MAYSGRPVPPSANISHSILHNPTFIQHNQNIDQRLYIRSGERPGYARLLENVATTALHDSVHVLDPPKCHPNTRVAIIQNIRDWTLGTDEELRWKPILWLKGGAGAGKSAIARSVAERCSEEGLLLGAFFFGTTDPTRNHVGRLVATLSYQISLVLPHFRDAVATLIEDDPLIFDRSIRTQFYTLLIRPLSAVLAKPSTASSATPCLIIIDGLDECNAVSSQRDLLFTLHEVISTTTLIRFLVCSRPESHLNNTFGLSHMVPIIYKIFLDDDYSASHDIRVYLEDKFEQIKEGHLFKHMLPDAWPTPETVATLVHKSSGQFIYAATVLRYVESPRHRPDQRLNAIFNLRASFKDLPFTELDALYRHIISKAEDLPAVLDVLAFPALYGNFEAKDIEAILQLEHGTVEVMLADLHSIVTIANGNVKFLHKSLSDFLSEPQRAGDLYRDLFRARLSHIARLIAIFSTHNHQQMSVFSAITYFMEELRKPDNIKADFVTSDILQASQQFPTFEIFGKPLLAVDCTTEDYVQFQPSVVEWSFIHPYFEYLYYIKDVCESTRLVYWKHIQEYCECILAVLDSNLSGNCRAHFVYAYYYLLHGPRYRLPWKLCNVKLEHDFSRSIYVGTVFGPTILRGMGWGSLYRLPCPYSDDITKISHDLIGDIEMGAIFAKSACFCLAWLCNERRAREDAGRIYGIARHDRRKKRDHPWHWRQMVPRPPSLGNRLVLICFRNYGYQPYTTRLTRIQKALRTSMPSGYRYGSILLFTMREYFEIKSQPPQPWPYRMSIKYHWQEWPTFIFLLDLLPHILPLAGRYEPLMDMCRKKCLSSLSQAWPKKSRRARQAIDSYLRRMDSQEGGE
ncbi:hypothetical protein D9613_012794 [Agrocybe pediades]|uniref:Nephrocystin 3-like N-terminal domain-containing protein n=1 Tax=Agrocybe pediades TaxID=84607 RepID=A0A8H4R3T2_9AGAR|nr:hypothetical protein D9613_012794 [Agrocybe pediades]